MFCLVLIIVLPGAYPSRTLLTLKPHRMNTFPLTPQGVTELTATLYGLPQQDLQNEADAVGADFGAWIKSHFDLTASQITYLDNIDQGWKDNAAAETKYALENQLEITLIKDSFSRGEDEGGDRGKLIDLDKKKQSRFSEENGFNENETLTYTISYPSRL